MRIRLLKLSNNSGKKDDLTARDILSIHVGHFQMNGKVTYSTNEPLAEKTDYVMLLLGNILDGYLCHVECHDYNGGDVYMPQNPAFKEYSPDKYKEKENVSWLVFNSMTRLSKEFIEAIDDNGIIDEFVHNRANDKIVEWKLNEVK